MAWHLPTGRDTRLFVSLTKERAFFLTPGRAFRLMRKNFSSQEGDRSFSRREGLLGVFPTALAAAPFSAGTRIFSPRPDISIRWPYRGGISPRRQGIYIPRSAFYGYSGKAAPLRRIWGRAASLPAAGARRFPDSIHYCCSCFSFSRFCPFLRFLQGFALGLLFGESKNFFCSKPFIDRPDHSLLRAETLLFRK